ncbi:MAG TPA: DoxX family protein [Gammaproteobacteria bacterium]|nr:DoxX family protein [Gammaproteobacteria bacterium]
MMPLSKLAPVRTRVVGGYEKFAAGLEWAAPVSLLLFRLWVATDFWRAGSVKFSNLPSTVSLFQYVYHVPLLPPVWAAYLGTGIELVIPWFIGLGLLGRPAALLLFVYNIIAVISYPALWPNGFWAGLWGGGFTDHKVWALMLLAIVLYGPGKLSLDHLLKRWLGGGRR